MANRKDRVAKKAAIVAFLGHVNHHPSVPPSQPLVLHKKGAWKGKRNPKPKQLFRAASRC